MAPFRTFCDLICSTPEVGQRAAEVVVAETGAGMTVFPCPRRPASWAEVCRGSNEISRPHQSRPHLARDPY